MEIKKTKAADLEGKRTTWFLLGLAFVLSVLFVSLEYTTTDIEYDDNDSDLLDELTKDVELTPITRQQQDKDMVALVPQKPQTVKKPTKIKLVDNTVATQEAVQLPEGTGQQDASDGPGTTVAKEGEEQTQALSPVATDMDDNQLNFRIVEDLPQFPGGAVELMKWLTKNLRYPASAQRQKVQGKVVVQFIVNKDGTIGSLKIVTPLRSDCDREALRVIRLMPKWKPGVQNDKPCRTMVRIPIVFKL